MKQQKSKYGCSLITIPDKPKSSIEQPTMKLLPRTLDKKLYHQNAIQNLVMGTCFGCSPPQDVVIWHPPRRRELKTTYMQSGKFTIVEIQYDGKHFHGLASRAPCDARNSTLIGGIAPAYHRAFKLLCEALQ